MARTPFSRIMISIVILALGFATLTPFPALADETITDSREIVATGVYVKGKFTLPIVQQPGGDFGFVSRLQDTVTQFGLAAQYGNTGLLGHNYLAGSKFFDLTLGERVYLFYGTNRIEVYIVTEILQYQALTPSSPYSDFIDLSTGQLVTVNDLFRKVYMGERHVIFQTCIARAGNLSWGRLFVIAEPLDPQN